MTPTLTATEYLTPFSSWFLLELSHPTETLLAETRQDVARIAEEYNVKRICWKVEQLERN